PPVQTYGVEAMVKTIELPLVERVPLAPAMLPSVTAGAAPLPQVNKGKDCPMVLNEPPLTLIVIGPPVEIAPATANGADAVLVTLLNSKMALPVVPTASVAGLTCVLPISVKPSALPSLT